MKLHWVSDTRHSASLLGRLFRSRGVPFAVAVGFMLAGPLWAYPVVVLARAAVKYEFIYPEAFVGFMVLTASLIDMLVLVAIVRFWERAAWSSLGFSKPSLSDPFLGVGTGLLKFALPLLYGSIRAYAGVSAPSGSVSHITPGWVDRWYFLVWGANVLDEDIFGAYVIERILGFTGSGWMAAVGFVGLDIALHIPSRGVRGAVGVWWMALLSTLLYLWRRNLLPCFIAHFMMDTLLVVVPAHTRRWRAILPWLVSPSRVALILLLEAVVYLLLRRLLRFAGVRV